MYEMEKRDELLVVWKNPITRNRIVIGRLWKDAWKFHFEYIRECENERGSIEKAIKMGYKPIKIFEDIDEKYCPLQKVIQTEKQAKNQANWSKF